MLQNKIFLGFILLIFYHSIIVAQTNKPPKREPSITRYIQDLYQYVKDKIRKNQYYENTLFLNRDNVEWSDKTQKKYIQSSHYSLIDDKPILRMSRCFIYQNEIEYEYHFLYDNDEKIILIYERQNDTNKLNYRELKVFFEKEKCINIIVDKQVIPTEDKEYNQKITKLQIEGQKLKQYFLQEVEEYYKD
jgi:hypothetical protein